MIDYQSRRVEAADAVLPDDVESAEDFADTIYFETIRTNATMDGELAIKLIKSRDAAIAKTVPDDVLEALEFYADYPSAGLGEKARAILTKYRPQEQP